MPTEEEKHDATMNWSDYSVEEKEQFLQQLSDETMEENGYDPVPLKIDECEEDDRYGQYDPNSSEIEVCEQHLGDFDEDADTALHEAGHAMNHQEQGDEWNSDPEAEQTAAVDFAAEDFDDEFRTGGTCEPEPDDGYSVDDSYNTDDSYSTNDSYSTDDSYACYDDGYDDY